MRNCCDRHPGRTPRFERPAALDHPDSTFMQLLGSPVVTRAGPRGLVESVAHHALCLQVIPQAAVRGLRRSDQIEDGVQTPAAPPMNGTAVDRHACAQGIDDPADRAALADTLLAVLKSRLGQRTIRSFFTVDVARQRLSPVGTRKGARRKTRGLPLLATSFKQVQAA